MSQTDETSTDVAGTDVAGTDGVEDIQAFVVARDGSGGYWVGSGPVVHIPASYVIGSAPDQGTLQLQGTGASPEAEQTLRTLRPVFGDEVAVTRFESATPAGRIILPPEE